MSIYVLGVWCIRYLKIDVRKITLYIQYLCTGYLSCILHLYNCTAVVPVCMTTFRKCTEDLPNPGIQFKATSYSFQNPE